MNIYAVVALIFGLMIGFSGRNIFKSAPPLGGFMVGGVLGVNLVNWFITPPPGTEGWFSIAAFVAVGLIFGLIAIPLRMLIIALTSSALGALVGAVLGFVIGQQGITRMVVEGIFSIPAIGPLQELLMVVFGVVFGALAIRFDDFMTIASTAFVGGFITANGLNGLFAPTTPVFSDGIFLFFLWLTVGTIGMIFQNRNIQD